MAVAIVAGVVLLMIGVGGYTFVRNLVERGVHQAEMKWEEEKAKAAAEVEAKRKEEEAEQQRLAVIEQERQARAAAEAEAKRLREQAEQQRLAALKAEQEHQARAAAAEAEAKRLREQAEQQRIAALKAEQDRLAKAAAEAEARRKADEAERQRQANIRAEQERQARADEAERQRLAAVKAEQERQARFAAEAEARRKSEEAEQRRLAELNAEQERQSRQAEPLAFTRNAALLGQFGDWGVYTATPGGKKTCFALARPASTASERSGHNRNPSYAFISTRPSDGVKNEVSVVVGYRQKTGHDATASIGSASYLMYTQSDGAWIKDPAQGLQMVETMRTGSNLVFKSESATGIRTIDTYSLRGIAQALDKVAEGCR